MQKLVSKYFLVIALLSYTGAHAQFYFFGRNKVQYEEFDWKVLKTEHFNIYYYDDFGEMAEIGAKFAEEAYSHHKVKFNHLVTRRIPLIFYNTHNHFQQTNTTPGFIPEGVGGFFEFLKGRVVIPFLGSLEQFRHVIWHELVHVFMVNKIYHVLANHRIPADNLPPLWFVEGLAEFWSTKWDTDAEMVMRDAILNGLFIDLETLGYLSGGFIMYKEGQHFLEFVKREYGEEKILLLMENFWRFPKFDKVIEFTIGESIQEINDKWEYSLKAQFYPLYSENMPHRISGKRITEKGFNFSPVFFEEDTNRYVFYIGNIDGYSSLYKQKLNEENNPVADAERIIKGEKEEVYEAFHLLKPSLSVSEDGVLAFVTKSGARDAIHLYSIKQDEIIKRFQFDDLLTIESPKFSDDGKKIVFSAIDRKAYSDIFVLDLETGELERMTNDYYSDISPIFSPDGERIIFSSDRSEGLCEGRYNLFELSSSSGKLEYLTFVNGNCSNPQFSKGTSNLFFTSDYEGVYNLYSLVRDPISGLSTGMNKQSNLLTSVMEYSFIDSNTIITSALEKFSFQFYAMNIDEDRSEKPKYVAFDFSTPKEKWEPSKIILPTDKEKLVYENEYTLDYAVSQVTTDPVYGSRGGALFSLSDLMSDDRYIFLIYNTAEMQSEILKNFNVAISRVNSKRRTNFGYGIFHFSGRRYDIRQSEEYFYERSFGGYLSFVYPFSSFQRLEANVSIANSDKDLFGQVITRKALLVTNTISYVHDNSLWGPTGPMDGSRFRLLLGYTSDVKYSNVNYYSLIADYRYYLRISQRASIASRGAIFFNHGKEARRYFAGGSWDLRGWKRFSIRGEKLWLSSLELRYPLIDGIRIKFPFLGIGLSNFRGAIFFDAGSAWDEEYPETLGSVGIGLRINFLNVITFRYDVGKKIENNFTKFQKRLFYQFFFGWDF